MTTVSRYLQRTFLLVTSLVVAGASLAFFAPAGKASADPACNAGGVYMLFARGMTAGFDSQEASYFFSSVRSALNGIPATQAQLGDLDGAGGLDNNGYPASPFWTGEYAGSVETGANELIAHLNERVARANQPCGQEAIVLGGYSEGADVIGRALEKGGLSQSARSHIAYISLYGDPKLHGMSSIIGGNCSYGTWLRGNLSCGLLASQGVLGLRIPYLPADFIDKSSSWCDAGDGICNGSWAQVGFGTHHNNGANASAYLSRWIAESRWEIGAAAVAKARALNPSLPAPTPPPPLPTSSPARSDVDNNGCSDLFLMTPTATGSAGSSLLSTCQGFVAQSWWNGTGLSWSGVTPLAGDVNGDKKADLVYLTNEGANGTKAFVSLSSGTGFGTPQQWWNGTGMMYDGIKASLGDADGNGCEDLVLTTNESVGSKAFVLQSTCVGFLAPQLWWNGSSYSWNGVTPLVGDVDNDKKADYVFLTNEGANGTKIFVAKSNGSSGFYAQQLWHNATGWGYTGIKPTLGDVDGNGGIDLVVATNEPVGSKAFVLRSTYQGFSAPEYWWNGAGLSWSGITPFTGDVNGDKKADFVILTNEGASGTKAFTAISSGGTFGASQLWWNGAGVGYSGIKAYLK